LGGALFFILEDCITGLAGGELAGGLYYWFCLRSLLEDCHRGHLLLGVLGSGARKPQGFLELGSQRGSVPSWLGGKDSVFFRQFQAVSNNRKERDKLLLQEVFYQY
jgi:hypothetical protein